MKMVRRPLPSRFERTSLRRQLPPLATAWIYGVAQLNLGSSAASLAVVGAITWYNNWQLKFF